MSRRASSGLVSLLLALAAAPLLVPAQARAQSLEDDMATMDEEPASSTSTTSTTGTGTSGTATAATTAGTDDSARLGDEQAIYEEGTTVEQHDPLDPRELSNHDYFYVGATARGLIVPEFIQGLFVNAQSGTPVNGAGGLFFNWRRNNFNVVLEAWYAGFGNEGFYRGSGEPETETEFVRSQLGVVFGSVAFGWSFPVVDWFAIELGFGLGFGGMVGNIYRQEAYRTGSGWAMCTGEGNPDATFCESPTERPGTNGRLDDTRTRGGTYQVSGGTPNPFYFGDGGIPPMFFWIDLPRVGVRFTPIRQVQIRIDGGYNLFGFNFGGSIGYGF